MSDNVTQKHKKARIFRDFLISQNNEKMFKEEEVDNAILFRSVYKVKEDDKKQFMLIFNDSVYITMQSLVVRDIPEDKREHMLRIVNQVQYEYPTVKYVITPEGHLMTSMTFHGTENTLDPATILMCSLEFFKVLTTNHYDRFLAVLA
ncbi:MAG: hypothetical protein ATN36_01935 [Epulopiscium sp. Nele67-Bin005]|nr:MAG: hypothetical protein ATN36_01935 [Epulopiscium sp. Nele67-Bin005]